jgi:two-component system response regulator PilR (NtrC family)
MNKSQALVVDDEPDICELIKITLSKMDVDAKIAPDLHTAKDQLAQQHFALCLTDMRLPDGDGIELVEYIQKQHPELPVAVITAYGSMELAVAGLKAGAFDFVSKPVDLNTLRKLVNQAVKISNEGMRAHSDLAQQGLLGKSLAMQALGKKIEKLARSQAPVYVSGGSGSGKELVARLIHQLGPRADGPFIPVNCGAIPENLMESEFFGHKKGSFTGAVENKQGLFQAACGGTLFLDEVADLPLPMQVKLLRAIQEKAIRPIGAQKELAIDVRLLSATHKNLHALVQQGSFRQDLFYRINVIELTVPSLHERAEDIPLLSDHILAKLAARVGSEQPKLSEDAIAVLQAYAFPGNVRELENILERAMTLCENNIISAEDLDLAPQAIVDSPSTPAAQTTQPLAHYLDDLERTRIEEALNKTRWNKTKAAKLLGITLRALRYRMKKLRLE